MVLGHVSHRHPLPSTRPPVFRAALGHLLQRLEIRPEVVDGGLEVVVDGAAEASEDLVKRVAEASCRDFIAGVVIADEFVDGRQAFLVEGPRSRDGVLGLNALEADPLVLVMEDAANLRFPVASLWVFRVPLRAFVRRLLCVRTARLEVRAVDQNEAEKRETNETATIRYRSE